MSRSTSLNRDLAAISAKLMSRLNAPASSFLGCESQISLQVKDAHKQDSFCFVAHSRRSLVGAFRKLNNNRSHACTFS